MIFNPGKLLIVLFTFLLLGYSLSNSGLKIEELSLEQSINPLGIDSETPRFSWKLSSNVRNQRQTAYQILVASSKENLEDNVGDVWDSGKVNSDQSVLVEYGGKQLESTKKYYWKIKAWNQDGKVTPWSKTAHWSMGLLDETDWQEAHWIKMDDDQRQSSYKSRQIITHRMEKPTERASHPSPYFRKEFNVVQEIDRATAYVSGVGYYELYLNGDKVGNYVLDPAQTPTKSGYYTKRMMSPSV